MACQKPDIVLCVAFMVQVEVEAHGAGLSTHLGELLLQAAGEALHLLRRVLSNRRDPLRDLVRGALRFRCTSAASATPPGRLILLRTFFEMKFFL